MAIKTSLAMLLVLGLASCGGNQASFTVGSTDTASIIAAPAGTAVLSLVDVLAIKPSDIPGALSLNVAPMGVEALLVAGTSTCPSIATSGTTSTYTWGNGCLSASGGAETGTVTATLVSAGNYKLAFNLQVVQPVKAGAPSSTTTYTGATNLAVSGTSASWTSNAATPLTITNTIGGTAKAWTFIPNLTATGITSGGGLTLTGSLTFQVGVTAPTESTVVAIDSSNPMIWTPNVKYPTGSLTLTYANAALMGTNTAKATVQFTPPKVTIDGATMNLGQ